MADKTVILPLKFVYPANVTRTSTMERGFVSEDCPVVVTVVDPSDAPLVGTVYDLGVGDPVPIRMLDDVVMRPVLDRTGEHVRTKGRDAEIAFYDLSNKDYPTAPTIRKLVSRYDYEPTHAHVPVAKDVCMFEKVRGGARAEAIVAHHAFASRLKVIDGVVWRPTLPTWSLVDAWADLANRPAVADRYRLRAQLLEFDYPDAALFNPFPGVSLPVATFDARLPADTLREALVERFGRGFRAEIGGDIALDVRRSVFDVERINPFLLAMTAWRAADGPGRSWTSMRSRERATYASVVADVEDFASGRMASDAFSTVMDEFAETMRVGDDPRGNDTRDAISAYLLSKSLVRDHAFDEDEVACLSP